MLRRKAATSSSPQQCSSHIMRRCWVVVLSGGAGMKVAGRRDSGSRKHNAAARAQVRDDGDPQSHFQEPQIERRSSRLQGDIRKWLGGGFSGRTKEPLASSLVLCVSDTISVANV